MSFASWLVWCGRLLERVGMVDKVPWIAPVSSENGTQLESICFSLLRLGCMSARACRLLLDLLGRETIATVPTAAVPRIAV